MKQIIILGGRKFCVRLRKVRVRGGKTTVKAFCKEIKERRQVQNESN